MNKYKIIFGPFVFFTFVIFSSTMTVDNSEGLYIFITTVWMQWECILEVSRIFFKQ